MVQVPVGVSESVGKVYPSPPSYWVYVHGQVKKHCLLKSVF